MGTIVETEQIAPNPPVVSPVIEPSLKCLDSKFDIGGYVECKNTLVTKKKFQICKTYGHPILSLISRTTIVENINVNFKLNGLNLSNG